jgi:hypothetical protein
MRQLRLKPNHSRQLAIVSAQPGWLSHYIITWLWQLGLPTSEPAELANRLEPQMKKKSLTIALGVGWKNGEVVPYS